jgi:hypothetical protein
MNLPLLIRHPLPLRCRPNFLPFIPNSKPHTLNLSPPLVCRPEELAFPLRGVPHLYRALRVLVSQLRTHSPTLNLLLAFHDHRLAQALVPPLRFQLATHSLHPVLRTLVILRSPIWPLLQDILVQAVNLTSPLPKLIFLPIRIRTCRLANQYTTHLGLRRRTTNTNNNRGIMRRLSPRPRTSSTPAARIAPRLRCSANIQIPVVGVTVAAVWLRDLDRPSGILLLGTRRV